MLSPKTKILLDRAYCAFIKRKLSGTCVEISEEVRNAVHNNLPVVALESTILTHGMPYPQNVDCALQVEEVVKNQGALPASIAILKGKIKVGLSQNEINMLGDTNLSNPIKTSRRDLAYVVSNKRNGGTTVSGTIIAADAANIPIFATGGIGGVHREAEKTFDISTDLVELGRSNIAVISSGIKSILDIPKTLEFLETQGVFVATFGATNDFPGFFTIKSGFKVPYFVETAEEAAKIVMTSRDLNIKSGMLFGVPIPKEFAFDPKVIARVIEDALKEAKDRNIEGKQITPFVLSQILKITKGESLNCNIALIRNNAKVAADIAVALSKQRKSEVLEDGINSSRGTDIERRPIIIGGSNMDCSIKLEIDDIKLDGRMYDSNFSYSSGGVGRNMCEAMFKLGCTPNFLSVVGDDFQGDQLKLSIPTACRSFLRTIRTKSTAQCVIVFDKAGNCKMLMGDMTIHKEITPKMILEYENFIKKSPIIVMDGNISLETMDEILNLAQKYDIPVFYEPTDSAIAEKPLRSKYNKSIKFMTPNLNELVKIAHFLNIKFDKFSKLEEIAAITRKIVEHVDNVIVTLGSRGILIARRGLAADTFLSKTNYSEFSARHYPTSTISNLVNVSGAGDCFASGLISALVSNKSEEICVSVGFSAASMALYSTAAVPETIFNKSHNSWTTPAKYITIV